MSSKIIIGITSFSLGAGCGVGAAYLYFKKKYYEKVNEDSKKYMEAIDELEKTNIQPTEKDSESKKQVSKVLSEYEENNDDIMGYYKEQASDYISEEHSKEKEIQEYPYIISPEEFGELYDYSSQFLTYYTDGILADMDNNIIEENDIIEMIGDFIGHFGDYADGMVHIRNDKYKSDYEIVESAIPFNSNEKGSPKIIIDE